MERTITLVSDMRQTYNGVGLFTGSEFEATEADALDLIAMRHAHRKAPAAAAPVRPVAVETAPVAAPVAAGVADAPTGAGYDTRAGQAADGDEEDSTGEETNPAPRGQGNKNTGYNRRDIRAKR